jgi:hypothetical protein
MRRLARVGRRLLVLCVMAGTVGPASRAAAEPIVTASYIRPGFETSTVFGDTFARALSQSFVVSDSGTLEQIEVLLFAATPGTFTMALHAAVDGAPVGSPLATATVSSEVVPESCCVPFPPLVAFRSLHAPVTTGQSLAIVMTGSGQAQWVGGFDGPFPAFMDQRFDEPGGPPTTPWQTIPELPGFNGGFRALVDPDVVPEPGTMILLGTGMVGLVGRRRGKRHPLEPAS